MLKWKAELAIGKECSVMMGLVDKNENDENKREEWADAVGGAEIEQCFEENARARVIGG